MRPIFALFCTVALAAACSTHTQNTSGAEYLARSTAPIAKAETVTRSLAANDGGGATESYEIPSTDELVQKAASIEPTLSLPARIGLARLEAGRLTSIPPHEAEVWRDIASRYPDIGQTLAIDPFLAELTARAILPQDKRALRSDAGDLITRIRLGAARQHVDAVLIYEIGARKRKGHGIKGLRRVQTLSGPLAVSASGHDGVGRALLIDVRNGYPYAILSASADLKNAKPDFWASDTDDQSYIEATSRIARALGGEADKVFREITLTAKRTASN